MAALPAARRVVIQPLHELRIELEKHEAVSIKLLNGTAEIFGHELTPNVEWPLGEEVRVAVYSWTGAEVVSCLASTVSQTARGRTTRSIPSRSMCPSNGDSEQHPYARTSDGVQSQHRCAISSACHPWLSCYT